MPKGKGAGDTSNYDAYDEEGKEEVATSAASIATGEDVWKEFDDI